MSSDCIGLSHYSLRIYLWRLGIFTFLWVPAPFFVSAERSSTILSTDRSEPRFESHTGVKKKENVKKQYNFPRFSVNFWLNQIQNCCIQINKRIFSFQSKKKHFFCWTLADVARHKNIRPLLDLTKILK